MRVVTAAVALSLLAAAPEAFAQKVLRYTPAADLTSLDAQTNTALVTAQYGMMVYDTLFSLDAKMQPRPQMVESFTASPDGLRWTFKLRPGLKFHDGQPVTSADVIPSIRRWMKRDALGRRMEAAMASFEPDGADAMTMTFKTRFPFVEMALGWSGSGMAAILRKQDAETDPMKPLTTSVGSGPFKFVASEWRTGASAAWERNHDYLARSEQPDGLAGGKLVKLDRVELKYLPDASTRANALKAGEIDFIDLLPVDLIPVFKGDSRIVVDKLSPFGGEGVIRMNQLHPPFNNLKARQALALTVDQTEFMSAAYGEQSWWRTCFSWFVCGSAEGTEAGSEPYRKQDLDKARQLLAESGYKGEPLIILTVTDVPSQYAMAQIMAANLRKIGANVDLQAVDFGQLFARRENKNPPAQGGGWHLIVLGYNGQFLQSPLTNPIVDSRCQQAPFGWPCDETVEKLRTAYFEEGDAARRKTIVEDLSRAAWTSLPSVLTGMYYNAYAWRTELQGLLKAQQVVFWNVDKVAAK